MVFMVIPEIKKGYAEHQAEKKEKEKIEKEKQEQQAQQTIKTGKTKTLYLFANYKDGIISVYLSKNPEWYPKGGTIKIVKPSGRVQYDVPGTAIIADPENSGIFYFSTSDLKNSDPKGWGVEIWE